MALICATALGEPQSMAAGWPAPMPPEPAEAPEKLEPIELRFWPPAPCRAGAAGCGAEKAVIIISGGGWFCIINMNWLSASGEPQLMLAPGPSTASLFFLAEMRLAAATPATPSSARAPAPAPAPTTAASTPVAGAAVVAASPAAAWAAAATAPSPGARAPGASTSASASTSSLQLVVHCPMRA